MKKLLLKNWRDIKARKAQFGALIILVALGISSYVSFLSGYRNLEASNRLAIEKLKFVDFYTTVISAPKNVVDKVRIIPGVKAVEGRLIINTGLYISDEEQASAKVVGIPTNRRMEVNDILIEDGVYLKGKSKDTCLLEKHYADARNLKPGDTQKLLIGGKKHEITIAGIFTSPEYFLAIDVKGGMPSPGNFAVFFMAQNEVERLFQKSSSYNEISVTIKSGVDREVIIDRVEEILEPYNVFQTTTQENQPSNFTILEEIKQNQSFAYMMPFLILTIAVLSLSIALSRLVQSQRGEIGLAKALGYRNWQILFHYLVFSLFIAFWGSVLGLILGNYFAIGIATLYIVQIGIPFLKHQLYMETVTGAVMMSTISCIFAGIVPAFVSARMTPARAMRADPNLSVSKGRTPVIEKLIAFLVPLPFVLKIPLRNVFRIRKRSAYTIIGIAFALIMTVATWGSFDSIDYLFDYVFGTVEKWDVVAASTSDFSRERVNSVKTWDGVKKVQPALSIPIEIKANGKKHETAITAMDPDLEFHGFKIIKGLNEKHALKMGGIIIPPFIQNKLGVDVGDIVKIETPYVKDREVEYKVLSISEEMIGTPIFMSMDEGRKLRRAPGDIYNSLYIDIDPRKASEIKKKLYDIPGTAVVIIKQNMLDELDAMMEFANITFGILLAFAFTMAFVVVYNTFTTNILERLREIATMRTIGEDRWHLAFIITLENLILAIAGIPLGLWLGAEAAKSMFEGFSSEAFTMKAVIYPITYLYVSLCILIVLLLSEIPPIRKVFKLNLAEATKIIE
ncbi:MAG: FtsX-like permease family protein [Actinomycetia bacterium]|nr:FtsX-like permease family protein [Actinomycetes bacterium]